MGWKLLVIVLAIALLLAGTLAVTLGTNSASAADSSSVKIAANTATTS